MTLALTLSLVRAKLQGIRLCVPSTESCVRAQYVLTDLHEHFGSLILKLTTKHSFCFLYYFVFIITRKGKVEW